MESEYKLVGDGVKEILWLSTLLSEFTQFKPLKPTPIFEDNKGCIKLALQQANHSSFRTKHIDIQHHFIREQLEEGIKTAWVQSMFPESEPER